MISALTKQGKRALSASGSITAAWIGGAGCPASEYWQVHVLRKSGTHESEKKMIKTFILFMFLVASSLSLDARAQDGRGYSYGPVTQVDYIHVEYGHFDEYMAWVTSTWAPTMEAAKKAGLVIGYKVFQASPKSPDEANVYLEITYKNMAAYVGDTGDQLDAFEAIADKVICNSACQNQARVHRNEIRRVLGSEVTREIILK